MWRLQKVLNTKCHLTSESSVGVTKETELSAPDKILEGIKNYFSLGASCNQIIFLKKEASMRNASFQISFCECQAAAAAPPNHFL